MGEVFRAVVEGARGFRREVVVKRILPHLAREPDVADMLVAEARLSALLRHPSIVHVYELGEDEGELFITMEYVPGLDLASLTRRALAVQRAIPVEVTCHVVLQLAAALAYAHGLRDDGGRPLEIVHRDVSPSNVMLMPSGGVKLLDFGVARAALKARGPVTRSGGLKGKLGYLAPEQAAGQPIDRRADIFALGIVFHECLTMRRLFRGVDDLQTLRLVREAEAPPPSSLRRDVDPALDAVVLKMLARDPAARFQDCDEVLAALAPVAQRLNAGEPASRRFLLDLEDTTAPDLRAPTRRGDVTVSGELRPGTIRLEAPRSRARAGTATLSAAALLALVSGGLFAFQVAPRQAAPAPVHAAPPPPVVVAAPPAAPPPPAASAAVRLALGGPAGAAVFLDGRHLGRVPLDVRLPATPTPRRIVVRKRGFQPLVRRVRGDADAVLRVALRPSRPSTARPASDDDEIKDPFAR